MAIVMGRLKNKENTIDSKMIPNFVNLNSKLNRTEEVCIQMDRDAQKDFTYRMTEDEYSRYKKNWWISLNKSGQIGSMRDRSDFNEALTKLHRLHQESGEEQLAPIPYWQYQKWHPSSSSSSTSWWQWNDSWWSSWKLRTSHTASELMKEQHIERGDPLCLFFTQPQTCRLSRFFWFVAVRSFTADSSLLQPTGGVNTTPHTSHFFIDLHAHAWFKACVWRAHITCHASSSCAHVVVLTLRDFSTFLSLLSIFSLIILSFLLAINFIFQVPCALQPMRTLALLPSTTLSQTLLELNKDNGLTMKYRNPKDLYCFQVSKFITRSLRHSQKSLSRRRWRSPLWPSNWWIQDKAIRQYRILVRRDEEALRQCSALVNWQMDISSGKRWRTEEKVSILLESELSSLFPVPSSNPRTFRKYNQSCIARQCIVIKRFYGVYLSLRKTETNWGQ